MKQGWKSRAATLGAIAVSLALAGSLALAQGTTPTPAQQLAELRADVQGRADHQAYPITGIKPDDVRAVLASLTSTDRDEWAAAWSAMGQRHEQSAAAGGDPAAVRENWRQAWLDYMFGAWPAQTSPGKRAAYAKSTAAFRAYGKLLDPPIEVVRIPFDGKEIVGYLQLPQGVRPAPVVICIGGLDEYKEYGVEHASPGFVHAGVGALSLDMPGTGEAPVKMEVGAERMISAAIDYVGKRGDVDPQRIAIYGVSAGGYWSALMGYVERPRLKAAVVRGGPIHGYFQPEWQLKSWGTKEYLFGLKEARMAVYGQSDDEAFLAALKPFSLLTRGILAQPSTRMLVVNGEKDSQVPIDDLYLLLRTGTPKYAWVNPTGGHGGRSKEIGEDQIHEGVVVPFIAAALATR